MIPPIAFPLPIDPKDIPDKEMLLKPMPPEYITLRRYALAQKLMELEQQRRAAVEAPKPTEVDLGQLAAAGASGIGIPYIFPKVNQALGIMSVPLMALGGATIYDLLAKRSKQFIPVIPTEGVTDAYKY